MNVESFRPNTALPFEDECRQALQGLRQALIEAFGEVQVDPARPRQAARDLGVDKNLAWRVSKIVSQPDVFQVVGNIPHQAGVKILCKAFRDAGAQEETLGRVSTSHAAFEGLVERHAGDRATFELVVGGLARGDAQGAALEQARKLAFRGNAAVWSVQSRVQVSTAFMAPSPDDPEMVDVVHIFGQVDLRRYRTDVRWILSRTSVFDDKELSVRGVDGHALDNGHSNGNAGVVPPLIHEFSTQPFPTLDVEDLGHERRFVLPEGPVGRTGELTALFGLVHPALGPRHAQGGDRFCQMISVCLTPAEHLHFDLFVHDELGWESTPRAAVVGRLDGEGYNLGSERHANELPFTEQVLDLGHGIAGAATPRMPWYASLVEHVFERLGWDPQAFRASRFEMAYPPMPAQVILYTDLPEAPGA